MSSSGASQDTIRQHEQHQCVRSAGLLVTETSNPSHLWGDVGLEDGLATMDDGGLVETAGGSGTGYWGHWRGLASEALAWEALACLFVFARVFTCLHVFADVFLTDPRDGTLFSNLQANSHVDFTSVVLLGSAHTHCHDLHYYSLYSIYSTRRKE